MSYDDDQTPSSATALSNPQAHRSPEAPFSDGENTASSDAAVADASEHRSAEGFRPYPPMRRPQGGFRSGRGDERSDRFEHSERGGRHDRHERYERQEHAGRADRFDRPERASFGRHGRHEEGLVRREHAVALVDARFVAWLGDHADQEPGRRHLVNRWLDRTLGEAGIPSPLLRSYWYSHQADERVSVPGQIERRVEQEARDGGASLVLALSRDLMALAEGSACDTVLIVSDDDRLLPVIDLAQARGLRVAVLADESAQDLQTLSRTEPGWTALLRQADARLIVNTDDVEDLFWGERDDADEAPAAASTVAFVSERPPRTGWDTSRQGPSYGERDRDEGRERRFGMERGFEGGPAREWGRDERPMARQRPLPPSAEELQALNERLTPQIQTWWRELPELERRNIETDMPAERGLPQEADRGLLLHISRELGRPLSPVEKKAMREVARGVVLREAEGAAGDHPSA